MQALEGLMEQLEPIEGSGVQFSLEPFHDLFEITASLPTHDAPYPGAIEFGRGPVARGQVCRYFTWAAMFAVIQRAAEALVERPVFAKYRREPVWQLVAREHGQLRCRVARVEGERWVRPTPLVANELALLPMYEAVAQLFARGQLEDTEQLLYAMLLADPVLTPVVEVADEIDVEALAEEVFDALSKHARGAPEPIGVLVLEYDASDRRLEVLGQGYRVNT